MSTKELNLKISSLNNDWPPIGIYELKRLEIDLGTSFEDQNV